MYYHNKEYNPDFLTSKKYLYNLEPNLEDAGYNKDKICLYNKKDFLNLIGSLDIISELFGFASNSIFLLQILQEQLLGESFLLSPFPF